MNIKTELIASEMRFPYNPPPENSSKETRDEFGVVPQKKSLENYVNFVKKGVHTTFIDDTMVKQMLVKGLITEEEFKAW